MKLETKTVTLAFEAPHEYAGLEVRLRRSLPLKLLFEFQKVEETGLTAEVIEQFAAAALVSWNLEDDDGPVPATAEGLMGQDVGFVGALIRNWQEVLTQPAAPLGGDSPNGGPSREPSVTTAVS